jgi:hypothetical protein
MEDGGDWIDLEDENEGKQVQLAPQIGAGSVTVFKCLQKKRVFELEG